MKQTVILMSLIALALPLALTGCCRVDMARLEDELAITKGQRDELQARLAVLEQRPDQSPVRTQELTGSFGELQKQVDAFISFREELQKREDELNKLRASALAEAQTAQARMDQLAASLQAETERVRELQGQLKHAQTAITELQDKLK